MLGSVLGESVWLGGVTEGSVTLGVVVGGSVVLGSVILGVVTSGLDVPGSEILGDMLGALGSGLGLHPAVQIISTAKMAHNTLFLMVVLQRVI